MLTRPPKYLTCKTGISVNPGRMYTQCKTSDIFRHSIGDRIHLLTGIGGKGMTASAGFAFENIKKYT